MFKQFGGIALASSALILSACNPAAELADADEEVAEFHKRFNAQDFEAIWNDSDEALTSTTTPEQFQQLMGQLHTYWGNAKSTEREGFGLNTNNGVTTVRVNHQTQFDTGAAVETFNFVRKDDELKLMGYDIKNPDAPGAEDEDAEE